MSRAAVSVATRAFPRSRRMIAGTDTPDPAHAQKPLRQTPPALSSARLAATCESFLELLGRDCVQDCDTRNLTVPPQPAPHLHPGPPSGFTSAMVEEVASGDAPKMEFAGRKRGRELHGVNLTRVTGEDRAGAATGRQVGQVWNRRVDGVGSLAWGI